MKKIYLIIIGVFFGFVGLAYADVDVETIGAYSQDNYVRLHGEVTDGNNVDVWFAVDDSSSVSCRDNDDEYSVRGEYDDGDDFYLSIHESEFEYGEKYYYRACAERRNDESSGSKRSFRIYKNSNYYNDYDYNRYTNHYNYFENNNRYTHHRNYKYCGTSPSFGPFLHLDRGKPISDLQRFLNCEMGANLRVDGIYGHRTASAARNYRYTNRDVRYGGFIIR